jgi:SAM-dependent methyltransferase
MSSTAYAHSEAAPAEAPGWLVDLLGIVPLAEGDGVTVGGHRLHMHDGILRVDGVLSDDQAQTADTFGYKWHKRETFESEAARGRMRDWLAARYGAMQDAPWLVGRDRPLLLLDAGCGAGLSALELFRPVLRRIRYLGVDVSSAVDVARDRFAAAGAEAGFLQADLVDLPLGEGTVDAIFSEGVLHHTDSTERALHSLARHLKPGGRFLFYVYRKKGPVREFTDDHIRERLAALPADQAWQAILPLTRLGEALGKLGATVEVPEDVGLLGIPAGPIDVQRLFYWHVCKAFYHPDLTLEEMAHINFDWFAPRNAHRQTPEEVRQWCAAAGLDVERETVEDAGITVIARKAG